jgi:hypothetical protein
VGPLDSVQSNSGFDGLRWLGLRCNGRFIGTFATKNGKNENFRFAMYLYPSDRTSYLDNRWTDLY